MKDSIDAHVEFSFKGETYSLNSTIELEKLFEHRDLLPSIHALLAHEHGIDTYSYLYEVMQGEDIEFRNAQGIAADFLVDGRFDHHTFAAHWQSRKILALLQPIAARELGIADLGRHEALKNALLQAYMLGRESAAPE